MLDFVLLVLFWSKANQQWIMQKWISMKNWCKATSTCLNGGSSSYYFLALPSPCSCLLYGEKVCSCRGGEWSSDLFCLSLSPSQLGSFRQLPTKYVIWDLIVFVWFVVITICEISFSLTSLIHFSAATWIRHYSTVHDWLCAPRKTYSKPAFQNIWKNQHCPCALFLVWP